ncbi:MAG: type II secretion system protein [Candidatus Dependentiae bacterium]
MIHFKSKHGFTLLEVLVSVMIVAMIMGPVFLWQTGVFSRTYQASGELNRLFIARNFFINSHLQFLDQQAAQKEEASKNPAMMMKYELKKVPANSAVAKFKDIALETINISWKEGKNKYTRRLVSFEHRIAESKQS